MPTWEMIIVQKFLVIAHTQSVLHFIIRLLLVWVKAPVLNPDLELPLHFSVFPAKTLPCSLRFSC